MGNKILGMLMWLAEAKSTKHKIRQREKVPNGDIQSIFRDEKRPKKKALLWHMVSSSVSKEYLLSPVSRGTSLQRNSIFRVPRVSITSYFSIFQDQHIKQEKVLLTLTAAESQHVLLLDNSVLWIHLNLNSQYSKRIKVPFFTSHELCLWCVFDRFIN